MSHQKTTHKHSSWESATIYQIYPRSFCELRPHGEPDRGEGTLLGIASKLDYLAALGVDVIWLSPFYPSPMTDSGYDISNYVDVDERYGTLADFDELVKSAHAHNIKLMVDFVPNHTSDQHPWFIESSSSRDNPKSDWYIWRDAKPNGSPPNNWASVFSLPQLERRKNGELDLGDDEPTPPLSAWQWDETRQQYYLHTFAVAQPDLDWSNPAVRQAMTDVMRFWLDRGVDGFRVDAVNHTGKDMSLEDDDPNPEYREGIDNPFDQLQHNHSANFADSFYTYLQTITKVFDEPAYADRDTYAIFETYVPQEMLDRINAVSPKAGAFNFGRMHIDWQADLHKKMIDEYCAHLKPGVTGNHVNGNHDNPRVASRIGDDQARAAAAINACLPGQMYIYNGEEAGLHNTDVPLALRDDALGLRDAERTPMPWNDAEGAGFTTAPHTWLPIASDFREYNIAAQLADRTSSVWLYKRLLALRRSSDVLRFGAYIPLETTHPDVMAFARQYKEAYLIVVVNFSSDGSEYRINPLPLTRGKIILSTSRHIESDEPELLFSHDLYVSPHEAIIIEQLS